MQSDNLTAYGQPQTRTGISAYGMYRLKQFEDFIGITSCNTNTVILEPKIVFVCTFRNLDLNRRQRRGIKFYGVIQQMEQQYLEQIPVALNGR